MFNRKKAEEVFEKSVSSVPPKNDDFYRVGVTTGGRTTLTLQSDSGMNMTLTLNQDGVRQMIRLLEATLPETADE
jgi:hypothetical protein